MDFNRETCKLGSKAVLLRANVKHRRLSLFQGLPDDVLSILALGHFESLLHFFLFANGLNYSVTVYKLFQLNYLERNKIILAPPRPPFMLAFNLSMYRALLIPNAAFLLLAASLHAAFAQNAAPPPQQVKGPSETMVVLGSATPVPLAESERSVEVLPVKAESLAAESPQDFLRKDSSVFLEERGAGGGQADIVLRGGSFEQTLVLLNGFRINDAQTSHHNLDLPVPLEAMDSIQVLGRGLDAARRGCAERSGGFSDRRARSRLRFFCARARAASNRTRRSLLAGATRGRWSGRVTAERNFSTGFMTDRDYRNEDASAESWGARGLA